MIVRTRADEQHRLEDDDEQVQRPVEGERRDPHSPLTGSEDRPGPVGVAQLDRRVEDPVLDNPGVEAGVLADEAGALRPQPRVVRWAAIDQ